MHQIISPPPPKRKKHPRISQTALFFVQGKESQGEEERNPLLLPACVAHHLTP
jgi:hypothetical protein